MNTPKLAHMNAMLVLNVEFGWLGMVTLIISFCLPAILVCLPRDACAAHCGFW